MPPALFVALLIVACGVLLMRELAVGRQARCLRRLHASTSWDRANKLWARPSTRHLL